MYTKPVSMFMNNISNEVGSVFISKYNSAQLSSVQISWVQLSSPIDRPCTRIPPDTLVHTPPSLLSGTAQRGRPHTLVLEHSCRLLWAQKRTPVIQRSEEFQTVIENLGRKLLTLCCGNIITGFHLSSLANLAGWSYTLISFHLNNTVCTVGYQLCIACQLIKFYI